MSNLGDNLLQGYNDIEALESASESPPGVGGDRWAKQYEAFLRGIIDQMNNAAPDTIRNPQGAIDVPVDNSSVHTRQLDSRVTNTDELLVTNRFTGPTVQTVGDLPNNAPAGTVFFVTNAGRYYTSDGQ